MEVSQDTPEHIYMDMDGVQNHLKKLAGYILRNREGIWYKEAREKGISIGAGSADKAA